MASGAGAGAGPADKNFVATKDRVDGHFAAATPELQQRLARSLAELRGKYDALHQRYFPAAPRWPREAEAGAAAGPAAAAAADPPAAAAAAGAGAGAGGSRKRRSDDIVRTFRERARARARSRGCVAVRHLSAPFPALPPRRPPLAAHLSSSLPSGPVLRPPSAPLAPLRSRATRAPSRRRPPLRHRCYSQA
jgi:hypothetical protein